MRYVAILLLVLSSACADKRIHRPGKGIALVNDYLHYEGRVFSGVVVERFDAIGTVRETEYRNGKPDGVQEERFESTKRLVARREYRQGLSVGVHRGWHLDGARRFHYEFDEEGKSHGEFWEWHVNGKPSLFARFDHGRLEGKKMWRDDGKIYMNYVFSEERAYGTPGTKLCYQVRSR